MKKKELLFSAVIFLVAALARIVLALKMPLDLDESWYLANSTLVMKGLLPHSDFFGRSPLLLLIMGLMVSIGKNTLFWGRMAAVIFSSATSLLVYKLTRRFYSNRTALASALLFALSPFVLRYSYTALTEPVSTFFVVGAYFLFVVGLEGSTRGAGVKEKRTFHIYFMAGLVLAMAVLVRRSAAMFLPGLPLLYLVMSERKGRYLVNMFRNLGMFFMGFAIVFIGALMVLFEPGRMEMALSMYDVSELWRYAGMEKSIVWNVKELSYQMFYFALLGLVFFCALMRKVLERKHYQWFLGSTVSMGIVLLYVFLPMEHIRGFYPLSFPSAWITLLQVYTMFLVLLMFIEPWKIFTIHPGQWKQEFFRLIPFAPAFSLAVILPGIEINDKLLQWMVELYLLGIVLLVLLSQKKKIQDKFDTGSANLFSGGLAFLFVVYASIVSRDMALEPMTWILMGGSFIFVVITLIKLFIFSRIKFLWKLFHNLFTSNYFIWGLRVLGILLILSSAIVHWHMNTGSSGSGITMSIFMAISLFLFAGQGALVTQNQNIVTFGKIKEQLNESKSTRMALLIPVLLIGIPFLFYFMRWWWMPIYFYEMTPGLCIAGGVVIITLFHRSRGGENRQRWRKEKRVRHILLAISLAVSLIIPVMMYARDPYDIYLGDTDQHPYPDTLRAVGAYIEENTRNNEEIFAWPVYGFCSGRNIIFNITHPLLYNEHMEEKQEGLKHFGYPTIDEIITELENKEIRFVVVDANMENVFLDRNTELEEYLMLHYNVVEVLDGVSIMLRAGCSAS